jgi:hypothetical protein
MIEYSLRPTRTRFAPQEPVSLEVTLRNTSRSRTDLPNPLGADRQPVFELSGPGRDQKGEFSAADLHHSVLHIRPVPPEIRLEKHAQWSGALYLNEQTGITGPGAYQLSSRLSANGSTLHAEPCHFEVDRLEPESYAGGFARSPESFGEGHIAFFHRGDGASYIYLSQFIEHRPGISEARAERPVLVHTAAPGATELSPAHSASAYFLGSEQWIAWREPGRIGLVSTLGLVKYWQPGGIGSLIRPILQAPDGSLRLGVLSEARDSVIFATLPPGRGSIVQPAWELPLPEPAHTATAQLSPYYPDEAHIAAVSSRPDGVLVQHVRCSGSRFPDAFNSVLIPGCRPIEASPGELGVLAILPRWDSSATVGTLVMAQRSNTPAYVELNFPPDHAGSMVAASRGPLLERTVTGAALHLRPMAGAAVPTGVIQLDGRLLLRYSDGHFVLTPIRTPPALPLILLPGQEVTYCVFRRDDGTPYLDRL